MPGADHHEGWQQQRAADDGAAADVRADEAAAADHDHRRPAGHPAADVDIAVVEPAVADRALAAANPPAISSNDAGHHQHGPHALSADAPAPEHRRDVGREGAADDAAERRGAQHHTPAAAELSHHSAADKGGQRDCQRISDDQRSHQAPDLQAGHAADGQVERVRNEHIDHGDRHGQGERHHRPEGSADQSDGADNHEDGDGAHNPVSNNHKPSKQQHERTERQRPADRPRQVRGADVRDLRESIQAEGAFGSAYEAAFGSETLQMRGAQLQQGVQPEGASDAPLCLAHRQKAIRLRVLSQTVLSQGQPEQAQTVSSASPSRKRTPPNRVHLLTIPDLTSKSNRNRPSFTRSPK